MKNFVVTVCAVIAVLFASKTVMAQDAVQWTEAEGGNGHWYAFSITESPLCWYEFADFAESMGGQLSSLETEAEFDFAVTVLFNGPDLDEKVFVGLEQSPDGDIAGPEEGWAWLSGVPLNFDPWDSSIDDAGGCHDHNHRWVGE